MRLECSEMEWESLEEGTKTDWLRDYMKVSSGIGRTRRWMDSVREYIRKCV